MLHGKMINIKSCIRPLAVGTGILFLILTVITNFVEDASDPQHANVMHVLLEEKKPAIYSADTEVIEALSPVIQTISQPETQNLPSAELDKQKMKIGYAQVEYALRLVKLDSFGQLVLNANTEASLSRAVSRLPTDLSEEQIAHILELINNSLPGETGARVADVFTKYYRYKVTVKELMINSSRPDNIDAAIEQLAMTTELRYEILGDEYTEKLFGEQQSRAEYHLERELVRRDSTISTEEKNQQLTLLAAKAKKNSLVLSSPSKEVQKLNADVEQMRLDGLDEELIQERREQTVGKDAAQQLALMEAQKNKWRLRYLEFEREKELILAANLDPDQQQLQVDNLYLLHYSAEELPGARAYDQQFAH